jgi:hypothetical protein
MDARWVIPIGILAIIAVSGCSTSTGGTNNLLTGGTGSANSCNGVFNNIVYIQMYFHPPDVDGAYFGTGWDAGSDLTIGKTVCNGGSAQGQNVNYLYFSNLIAHKKDIDNQVNFLSDSYYNVGFVLKKSAIGGVYSYDVVSSNCQPIGSAPQFVSFADSYKSNCNGDYSLCIRNNCSYGQPAYIAEHPMCQYQCNQSLAFCLNIPFNQQEQTTPSGGLRA